MTNKINGIDVSECCFYNNGKCDNPNGMACNCINNAVCYYKELKRLQQENKCLKEEIELITDKKIMTFSCFKHIKEYQEKLEQSNEAYKQSEQEAKEIIAELLHKNEELKEKNKELLNLLNNDGALLVTELAKTKKYKQVLEDIREVIEMPKYTCKEFLYIRGKINEALKMPMIKKLTTEDLLYSARENNKKLKQEINNYKQALEEIRSYCDEQNLKADYTACYITNRIDEVLNDRN